MTESITLSAKTERNGRLLCSPRNPTKEAQDWVLRQKISNEDRTVLVLGFGAGFHARELHVQFPNLQIEIYELDEQIRDESFSFIKNLSVNTQDNKKYDAILAFRPAWAGYESEYLRQYIQLTGRDIDPEKYFSEQVADLKIWYCLRELVK